MAPEPYRIRIRSPSLLKKLKEITGFDTTVGPYRHRLTLISPFKMLVTSADTLQEHLDMLDRTNVTTFPRMYPNIPPRLPLFYVNTMQAKIHWTANTDYDGLLIATNQAMKMIQIGFVNIFVYSVMLRESILDHRLNYTEI